jgi:hypothetical protein
MNIYMIATQDHKVFGVGQTTRSFEDRHKDGDWAKFHNYLKARDEELELIGWWPDVDVVDHDIHRFLVNQPNIRKYAEWFKYKSTLDIIKHQIEEEFFTSTPEIKDDLILRQHQTEFVNKARTDYEEFLLFAKCRAGKSIMVLSHIVDTNRKVSLVVSRYTSPSQSWREDSNNFSNFDNLVFIDVNDKDYIEQIDYWYNTDKQIVLWACVQSRKILSLPVDVDLLVYDEAHVGYNSTQWNNLREVTNCPVLYVTGTAYKMVWDFSDSDRFIYSYFEEQRDKKLGLNDRPSMNVTLAKYQSSKYQDLFGDDPDAMKNLFEVDMWGEFVQTDLVEEFVSKYFSPQRELRFQDRLLRGSKHLYITLPSVPACKAFAELLKGTRYAPLVVTGDSNNDSVDINKHIEENPNGSAILTRTANVLGVTASKVDTIINCAEGKSIEFWTQFAFRGGSSDNDWRVIDFVPQRCLESLRTTFVASCDTSPEVSEYDLLDYVNVSEWSDGFTTLTQDQVCAILSEDVGNSVRLVSGIVSSLDFGKLRDLDFNLDLEPVNDSKAKSIVLNDNDGNGKTNKQRVNELNKSEKDDIYKKIDTIQAILERFPLVMFHIVRSGQSINNLDSILDSEHYVPVTFDNERIIDKALEYGIIDRKSLSYRINQAGVDVQHAVNKDDVDALYELSRSPHTQEGIPVDLFEDMLSV